MSNITQNIVNKAWNFAHVLRDDGLSYMGYTEQISFLLFLKMAHQRTQPPHGEPPLVPPELGWGSLLALDGDELEVHYRHILEELSKKPGMLGEIFKKARPDIQNPATLKRLIVDLIEPENWLSMQADIKGDIYEGLLSRSAEESPKGAGQYFTPRAVIQVIVDVAQPKPADTVCDPACGTAGFLLAAHAFVSRFHASSMDVDEKRHLRTRFVQGMELVPATGRLAIMNLLLHGINTDVCPIQVGVDSLAKDPGEKFSLVLTNPPFGKKSSFSIVNEEGDLEKEDHAYQRDGFWVTTKNKQLNFLQHVTTLLKMNGRCAIVVPDNVLFEGGAGETVRLKLLKDYNVHTLLRLPTGIFYAQGVKANVLFFDAKPAREAPWTDKLWVYDFRTNVHFTLKTKPLRREHLDDFIACYFHISAADVATLRDPNHPARPSVLTRLDREPTWSEANPEGRWRAYDYEELIQRDKTNLDIFWLKDKSLEDTENLPEPDELARSIAEDLRAVLEQFEAIAGGIIDYHDLER